MIVRIFDTAMEPDDIERAKELFRDQVRPAFADFDGCLGIEMFMGIDEHSRDLVDVAAVSRWESMAAIEKATALPEYEEALKEIRELFQQAPIVRHFEAVD
jgi:quinol monooxygenase YgiN